MSNTFDTLLALPIFTALLTGATSAPIPTVDAKADVTLSKARAYTESHSLVPRLAYSVAVTLTTNGAIASRRTYDSAFDGSNGEIYADSISEEERSHPIVPRGFNVVISSSASTSTGKTGGEGIALGRPLDEADVIGEPVLAPVYYFGLARLADRSDGSSEAKLRTITRTRSVNREYDTAYIGDDLVAGETCSHLSLVPVTHPERHRLRELWIAADGAPLRAIVHGNLSKRPWDGVDWTVTFRRDPLALFIDSETTNQSVRIDKLRQGFVTIQFQSVIAERGRTRFLLHIDPDNAVREPDGI